MSTVIARARREPSVACCNDRRTLAHSANDAGVDDGNADVARGEGGLKGKICGQSAGVSANQVEYDPSRRGRSASRWGAEIERPACRPAARHGSPTHRPPLGRHPRRGSSLPERRCDWPRRHRRPRRGSPRRRRKGIRVSPFSAAPDLYNRKNGGQYPAGRRKARRPPAVPYEIRGGHRRPVLYCDSAIFA